MSMVNDVMFYINWDDFEINDILFYINFKVFFYFDQVFIEEEKCVFSRNRFNSIEGFFFSLEYIYKNYCNFLSLIYNKPRIIY